MGVIYIAGPYLAPTEERISENIRQVTEIADEIFVKYRVAPLVPHFNVVMTEMRKMRGDLDYSWEEYMLWDGQLLDVCDALYFHAPSPGANLEYWRAKQKGLLLLDDVGFVPHMFCRQCHNPIRNLATKSYCPTCTNVAIEFAERTETVWENQERIRQSVATRIEERIGKWEEQRAAQGTARITPVETG